MASCIILRRLFVEMDNDGDKVITFSELRQFLEEIKFRQLQGDKDDTAAEIMKEFDLNNDGKITQDEFINGMRKWVDDTKGAMNKRYHSVKSLKDMYQVFILWLLIYYKFLNSKIGPKGIVFLTSNHLNCRNRF